MSAQLHKNELIQDSVGQIFKIQLLSDDSTEDISDADSFELRILKPDIAKTILVRTALTVVGTRFVEYTIVATDIDVAGNYRAHVIFIKGIVRIKFPLFIYHADPEFAGPGVGGGDDTLI